MQILRLIVRGKTSKEIARMLEVSVQTVLSQRQSLMQKMGAKNVAGLIFAAMAKGLNVP